MSVRVMSAVWNLELPDSEKIVLLALADCANDEGHCWPGIASLMRKCTKGERTIQGAIKALCEKGHLTRREVLGKGCNYTVHPRTDCAPAGTAPPQGTTQTPAAAAGKPSVTIKSEAKASYKAAQDLWNNLAKSSGIPECRVLNNSRTQMMMARAKEHGWEAIFDAIRKVHASPFCRGERGDGRKADIMLILQPKTLPRVLEGFYGADEAKPAARPLSRDQLINAIRFRRDTGDEEGALAYEAELERSRKVVPIGQLAGDLMRRSA